MRDRGDQSSSESEADKVLKNEIAKYLTQTFSGDNPLEFWRSSTLKILPQIARCIYTILASSAGSERRFSVAGKVQRVDRALFAPEKLCAQVIVSNKLRQS